MSRKPKIQVFDGFIRVRVQYFDSYRQTLTRIITSWTDFSYTGMATFAPCAPGARCSVHGPSAHPLRSIPITVEWNQASYSLRILRKCEHGLFHLDPDFLSSSCLKGFSDRLAGEDRVCGVDCDGCCERSPKKAKAPKQPATAPTIVSPKRRASTQARLLAVAEAMKKLGVGA